MLRWSLLAAQVEPAVADAQRLVDVLLVELERERRARARRSPARRPGARPRRSGGSGSRSPGARAATSPSARRTNSLRMSCAALAASGERSGLTTSWPTPVESRRSMKTSPPWSRRRATQPASVCRCPTWSAPKLARAEVAPAHSDFTASASERELVVLLAARGARSRRRARDDSRLRAESPGLRQLALQRAARVVGVGGTSGAAELAIAASTSAARRPPRPRRRRRLGRARLGALLGERQDEPLDAAARSRRPASAAPPISSIR